MNLHRNLLRDSHTPKFTPRPSLSQNRLFTRVNYTAEFFKIPPQFLFMMTSSNLQADTAVEAAASAVNLHPHIAVSLGKPETPLLYLSFD